MLIEVIPKIIQSCTLELLYLAHPTLFSYSQELQIVATTQNC